MGERIRDVLGAESDNCCEIKGMGLLPLVTDFEREKVTVQAEGSLGELDGPLSSLSGMSISGYEIHMGRTKIDRPFGAADTARLAEGRLEPEICRPAAYLMNQGSKLVKEDGWNRGNIYGSYLHGVFDGPGIAETLAASLAKAKGIRWEEGGMTDYREYRQLQYDRLAAALRESLDMEAVYGSMGMEYRRKR